MPRVIEGEGTQEPSDGRVHEKGIEPKPIERVTTLNPDNAIERLSTVLGPFIGCSVNSEELLNSSKAPMEYTDSIGRVRKYSFPREFKLVMIESPRKDISENVRMWTLGIGRTEHDPKSGRVERS